MYRIHRSDMVYLRHACDIIEGICNIPLEVQECQKIIAKDVNNYINIIDSNTIKFKGAYEIDRDFHKNHSKRIVALSAANYFINDIDFKDTIDNHLNKINYNFGQEYVNHGIYDFCIGNKSKYDNKLYKRTIIGTNIIDEELGKVNRYYISNKGADLIKIMPPLEKNFIGITDKIKAETNQINIFDFVDDVKIDPSDRETNIEAGHKCTLFNIYNDESYDLNYNYYYNEANKLINFIIDEE